MTQLVNRRVGSYWVVILYWSKKSHWHQGALVTGRKQRGSFSRWSLLYGCILYTLPARYIYTHAVSSFSATLPLRRFWGCKCFFLLTLRDEQIYKADQRTRAQQLLMHMLWNQKNKAIYKPSESLGFPVLSARARGKWRPPAIQIIKNLFLPGAYEISGTIFICTRFPQKWSHGRLYRPSAIRPLVAYKSFLFLYLTTTTRRAPELTAYGALRFR